MQKICILTDNRSHYIQSSFPGNDLVKIIPFSQYGSRLEKFEKGSTDISHAQKNEIRDFLKERMTQCGEITIITSTKVLGPLPGILHEVIDNLGNPRNIKVYDSRTTSVGLGILVQRAAEMASRGAHSEDIDELLRRSIPAIYSLLYLPDLNNLAKTNFLSTAQAVVGEMLGIQPVFSLENDCLTPIRKVRSPRQVQEIFQDFLDEFPDPYYAALVKADRRSPIFFKGGLNSRDPGTKRMEFTMNSVLKDLLGSHAVGLFVAENF